MLLSLLNDYYVMENGYYDDLYHVTSRVLTDGRGNTGGWGSKTSKRGNYIQATYAHPVYVTSVTIAGGYIPSWRHNTTKLHGSMDLEYSSDEKSWNKVRKIEIVFCYFQFCICDYSLIVVLCRHSNFLEISWNEVK